MSGEDAELEQETSVELVALTDEELAAIDTRPPESRLVVYPFFDNLEEHDQQVAIAVAFRSLAARGLLVGPSPDKLAEALAKPSNYATVEIDMNEALRRMLEMRLGAPRAIVAQRTLADTMDFCYFYLYDDDVVLREYIQPTGLHEFWMLDVTVAPAALEEFVNPTEVEGSEGDTEFIDAQRAAEGHAPVVLLEKLGEATTFSEFFLRHMDRDEHPPLTGVFAGPHGLHVMTSHFDSGDPVPVTPTSRAGLLRTIKEVWE